MRDERHLADDVAFCPASELVVRSISVLDDAHNSFNDDVQLVAELALGRDRLAVGVAALLGDLCHALEIGGRKVGKQRDRPEEDHAFDQRDRSCRSRQSVSFDSGAEELRALSDE